MAPMSEQPSTSVSVRQDDREILATRSTVRDILREALSQAERPLRHNVRAQMYSNGLFGLVLLSSLLALYISTVGAQFSPVVDLDSMNTYLFVLLPPMYGFIWYINHRNLKRYRTQALQGVTYAIDSSRNHSTSGATDEDSMTDFSRFLFLELQRHHGQPGQSPFSLVLPAEYEDALATADSHDEFLKRVLHDRGLLDESVDADELDAYRLRVVPDSDGPELA